LPERFFTTFDRSGFHLPAFQHPLQNSTVGPVVVDNQQELSIPRMTPERLAQEAGISLRTLHRLFALSGTTVSSWLRAARLERCWRDLRDPTHRSSTVAAVAFSWGFSDLRTFNRAFTARYGMTPSAARRQLELATAD
jgi:AraC-like DNA-binding protein